ncbi:MAG: baseplate J/gp47 family protein [Lentisphaeria bacterium]|nr:baseplate J/gp47 family protein [Lentisphaeria bacterium]
MARFGLPDVDYVEVDPNKIKADIIAKYEAASGRVLADGDPVRLLLLSIASLFIQFQNNNNTAARQNTLPYAMDEKLDLYGAWLQSPRLSASPAVTAIEFTLEQVLGNDYAIPAGFAVTNGIVTFATDKELIIPAGQISGQVSASCTIAGTVGNNYLAGQISTIVQTMAFLAEAKNIGTTSGGAEEESDEDYAERLRLASNKMSVAGSHAAYIYHARSVNPAIIDVALVSPSACIVDIYPLLTGGELPTTEILNQVTEYFAADNVLPFTDFVTAKTPAVHEYSINVDYYITSDDLTKSEAIRSAVTAAVEEYRLWQQSKIGRAITPEKLIQRVMTAGASHVDLITLSPGSLVELNESTVARCTGVTVTYKGVDR